MANGYINSTPPGAQPLQIPYASSLGRVPGHTRMAVYGHRASPAVGDDIWEGGGGYPFQTTATKLEILSASASDTAAGTGARTVTVQGLDGNFNQISETMTLNGVTPVQSVNSYLRVNDMRVVTSGSGHKNAGDITLRVTGAGATQSLAKAGYNYAKQCVFTVPSGFTLLVTDVLPECGGTSQTVGAVFGFVRTDANLNIQITNEYNATGAFTPLQRTVITGAVVPAMSAVTLRVTVLTGAPPDLYGSINGVLVDNTYLT